MCLVIDVKLVVDKKRWIYIGWGFDYNTWFLNFSDHFLYILIFYQLIIQTCMQHSV